MLNTYSSTSFRQFSIFRFIFGIYLIWHFATLIPFSQEIFSSKGIMGAQGINPYRDQGAWPNPFFVWENPVVIHIALLLGVVASVLFTLGKFTRYNAIGLWFLMTCLYTSNPLTLNPSLGYVGLLLLLSALVSRESPYLPRMIPITAWSLLAIGYSYSGIFKLTSPSWIDGSAMTHLMSNPLARPGLARDMMLSLPEEFMQLLTWGTLALEVLFVPLAILKVTRPYAWLAMLLMHFGIMLTVDFADLSLGMIMIHLFTFQRSWLPVKLPRILRHPLIARFLNFIIPQPNHSKQQQLQP